MSHISNIQTSLIVFLMVGVKLRLVMLPVVAIQCSGREYFQDYSPALMLRSDRSHKPGRTPKSLEFQKGKEQSN
jgi:hypothetical protein